MLSAFILFAASIASGPCSGPDAAELAKLKSLPGEYAALPVLPELQPDVMKRLANHSIKPIEAPAAMEAVGNQELKGRQHYYLARVGYLGAWTSDMKGRNPFDISFKVQAAADGVAYVTSSLLSRDNGVGEVAVVLASPTPLQRIVSICEAAT